MEYVYLLIEDYSIGSERDYYISAYSTLEKAQKQAKKRIKEFKKIGKKIYDVIIEDEYYYTGYCYTGHNIVDNDHTTIYIEEKEVK